MTLGKSALCRVLGEDTRQRVSGGDPLPSVLVCPVSGTRQTWSLPSVIVCRVLGIRQTTSLPSASCLPSAFCLALDKQPLYRVSDKKHSAKSRTLSKEAVSGSASLRLLKSSNKYNSKMQVFMLQGLTQTISLLLSQLSKCAQVLG